MRLFLIAFGAAALLAGLLSLHTKQEPIVTVSESAAPAPYPADLAERAARVQGIALVQGGELPQGLVWQDGSGQPDIGDPAAVKGGCLRLSQVGPYPAHWLVFGSGTPQFFHFSAFTSVEVPLVARHPQTGADIPGTACSWAVAGQAVYFRLNPRAQYSNGRPLRAGDYLLGALLRAECGDTKLAETASELRIINDQCLVLQLRQASALPVQRAAALLHAAEPAFYADFGSDYRERYAQRIPPTTGAYTIERTERGRLIELRRVRSWWAAKLPYYRHTCNVDRIEYHFLTDEAQAWEYLLRGRLDFLQMRSVTAWQERAVEIEGRKLIRERLTADYPLPPYGIAFNCRTLPDIHLRRGLMHALDMDRVIALLTRGEGERLHTFSSGYGALTPTNTPQIGYDPAVARKEFAAAGYAQTGEDGILRNSRGQKLQVSFTYTPNAETRTMADVLTASARRCGVELLTEAVPWQTIGRRCKQGLLQLSYWASVAPTPLPDYRRFFGRGATGYEAPFGIDDAELERRIIACEQDPTAERVAAVDHRVQELALWLPGRKENRVYLIRHPRLHLPPHPFSAAAPYDVAEAHLYWLSP